LEKIATKKREEAPPMKPITIEGQPWLEKVIS